ncbi:C-terminal binding protein [Pelotomaculum propionicicum]|uniref:C-terminal binding protein n=1 Tax=Pelotomaculum propionicicum TaxID=258475 RepID=UPI003B7E564A
MTANVVQNHPLVWILDDEFGNHDLENKLLRDAGMKPVYSTTKTFVTDYPVYAQLADAVILQVSFRISDDHVMGLARCRVISVLGAGYDNVPLEAASMRRIPVCTIPDYCAGEVSDHTLALLLALSRRITAFDTEVRQGYWQPLHSGVQCLAGQALGLVGFGRIAQVVARKASVFDLRVLSYDPFVESSEMALHGVRKADLDTLLSSSDYVSIHIPLSSSTEHLIGARELACMKRTAFLINTSRGSVIDENALSEALRSGVIAGAALDVMKHEPPAPDNYLVKSGKTIITPHAAYYSEQSLKRLRTTAVANVLQVLEGRPPLNTVNFPAITFTEKANEPATSIAHR